MRLVVWLTGSHTGHSRRQRRCSHIPLPWHSMQRLWPRLPWGHLPQMRSASRALCRACSPARLRQGVSRCHLPGNRSMTTLASTSCRYKGLCLLRRLNVIRAYSRYCFCRVVVMKSYTLNTSCPLCKALRMSAVWDSVSSRVRVIDTTALGCSTLRSITFFMQIQLVAFEITDVLFDARPHVSPASAHGVRGFGSREHNLA